MLVLISLRNLIQKKRVKINTALLLILHKRVQTIMISRVSIAPKDITRVKAATYSQGYLHDRFELQTH